MNTIMLAVSAGLLAEALTYLWFASNGGWTRTLTQKACAVRVLTYGAWGGFLLYVGLRWV